MVEIAFYWGLHPDRPHRTHSPSSGHSSEKIKVEYMTCYTYLLVLN